MSFQKAVVYIFLGFFRRFYFLGIKYRKVFKEKRIRTYMKRRTVKSDMEFELSEVRFPEYKSVLYLHDCIAINSEKKRPNIIWRFFQYLFFGFRWEDIK